MFINDQIIPFLDIFIVSCTHLRKCHNLTRIHQFAYPDIETFNSCISNLDDYMLICFILFHFGLFFVVVVFWSFLFFWSSDTQCGLTKQWSYFKTLGNVSLPRFPDCKLIGTSLGFWYQPSFAQSRDILYKMLGDFWWNNRPAHEKKGVKTRKQCS